VLVEHLIPWWSGPDHVFGALQVAQRRAARLSDMR
jgi:hypothetical protein